MMCRVLSLGRRLVWIVAFAPVAFAAAPDPLETVQKSAADWVKLRTETARLDTEWRSERTLLDATVKALEERVTIAEEKRDNAKAKGAENRKELDELAAKNRASAADLDAANTRLKALDARIAALRPQLPPRLAAAIELPCRSLESPDLPVGERMQLTTTVLNRCAQFNQIVTAGTDVLAIQGEPAAKLYPVIYWGLSHGYAIDPTTKRVWLGVPAPGGWSWEPRPNAYAAVAALIAINGGKADPDFVPVPARLAHPAGSTHAPSSP